MQVGAGMGPKLNATKNLFFVVSLVLSSKCILYFDMHYDALTVQKTAHLWANLFRATESESVSESESESECLVFKSESESESQKSDRLHSPAHKCQIVHHVGPSRAGPVLRS